ncbi:GNAT family N-acetyltransferase [soil metagenome]
MITPVRGPAQLAEVRRLFEAYLASLSFDLDFQGFADELATLPGNYAPPGGELLLAHLEDRSVCCVAMRPLGPGVCEMKRLFLDPAARSHGLGQALVAAIIGVAREHGYTTMRLDTAADSMGPAVALYKRFGFREIAAYTPNPLPDALFLELAL